MLLYHNICIFGSRIAFFYYVIFQLMDLSFFGKPWHLELNCMVPSHVHKLPLKPVWEIVWVCFILISRLSLVKPCRLCTRFWNSNAWISPTYSNFWGLLPWKNAVKTHSELQLEFCEQKHHFARSSRADSPCSVRLRGLRTHRKGCGDHAALEMRMYNQWNILG